MCQVLQIHRSGFYTWLQRPVSSRQQEDTRLLGKIKQFWLESGCTYGYRNITTDLKNDGERCGKSRVLKIMRENQLKAIRGYQRHPGFRSGVQHHAAPNTLNRAFTVKHPNRVWLAGQ